MTRSTFFTTGEGTITTSLLMTVLIARTDVGRPYEIQAFSCNEVLPKVLHYGSRTYSLVLTKRLEEGQIVPGERGDVIVDATVRDAIRRRHVVGGRQVILGIRTLWTDPERRRIKIAYPLECALYVEKEAA